MSGPRLQSLGALLIGLALCLAAWWVLDPHVAPPHQLGAGEAARLALALPVALLLPGVLVAGRWLRGSVEGAGGGLSLPWLLTTGAGLNVVAHALNLNLLRGLGLPIVGSSLAALLALEGALALLLLRGETARIELPGRAGAVAALAAGGLLVGATIAARPLLWTDSSWYWTSPELRAGWAGASAPERLGVERPGWAGEGIQRPPSTELELNLVNAAPVANELSVAVLVHGPLGGGARLLDGGRELAHGEIQRIMRWGGPDDWDERYARWGSVLLYASLRLERGTRHLRIELGPGPAGAYALVDWTGLSSGEVHLRAADLGLRVVQPYQLLNVTENVRWADEVLSTHVLPGSDVSGSPGLNQPPAWTYVYAPLRALGSRQLASASLLLLLILAGLVATSWSFATRGLRLDLASAALVGAVLGVVALHHGRLMVSDGSMNFPDNLYALALLLAVAALADRRAGAFVLWGALAALLRYPGVVVVAMAAGLFALQQPRARRWLEDAVAGLALVLGGLTAVAFVLGALSGLLWPWLWSLYFETVPEHFRNQQDSLPLLRRPVEFLRLWGLYGGALVLPALPLRGERSRLALGTALAYAPFLAFIDHFSAHYFLPLIALVGAGATASLARIAGRGARIGALAGALALVAGLWLAALR